VIRQEPLVLVGFRQRQQYPLAFLVVNASGNNATTYTQVACEVWNRVALGDGVYWTIEHV
jgi:hypothetical protein